MTDEIDELKENLMPYFGYFGGKRITQMILETTPRKGRKRLAVDKVKIYSFSLHPEDVEKLGWIAHQKGVTKSQIIRDLINEHL